MYTVYYCCLAICRCWHLLSNSILFHIEIPKNGCFSFNIVHNNTIYSSYDFFFLFSMLFDRGNGKSASKSFFLCVEIFIFILLFRWNRFLTNSFERFYDFTEHVVNGICFQLRDVWRLRIHRHHIIGRWGFSIYLGFRICTKYDSAWLWLD